MHRYGCITAAALGALLAGFALWYLAIGPTIRIVQARSWQAVPCEIVSSEVQRVTSSGTARTTYRILIVYRYSFGGREHTSDRYDLTVGTGSSGIALKQRVVDRHPRGSRTTCFVNPDKPYQAVLDRGLQPSMLWALLPLVLFVLSVLGLLIAIFMIE